MDQTAIHAQTEPTARIRVVFLIRSLGRGGAERQLAELAARLNPESFEVVVLTFYSGGAFWEQLAQTQFVRLESLSKRGRFEVVRFAWRLVTALRRWRPALLHCYLVEPSLFGLLAGRFAGVQRIVLGVRASSMNYDYYGYLERLSFGVTARLARFADAVIANSEAGRRHYIHRGYPVRNFSVIPNGIDTERFCPDPATRTRMRKAWGVSEQECLVGIIARLDPMKGHRTLIHAAAVASRRCDHMRFVAVGGGSSDFAEQLQALTRELGIAGRWLWAGEYHIVSEVYPALDVACSSSIFGEGFSNSLGEAMSSGVPCVATDVGDSASIVGETGYVVAPDDVDGLAEALMRMARLKPQERANLGVAARQRIVARFSVQRMVERTTDVYRKLLDERRCV